jgi:uncharacterized protein (TIRG00374 family)
VGRPAACHELSVPLRLKRRWLPRPLARAARVVAVLLVIEYLLVPQLAGSRKSWHLLLDVRNGWLLAGFGLEMASLAVYGLLTRAVLPHGPGRPSLWTLLRIDLSTLAVSHVVPAGSAVGLGLGYRLLTQAGIGGGDAVMAKATQAVGSAVVLNLLLLGALVVAIPLHGFSAVFGSVALVGVLLLAAAGGIVTLLTRDAQQAAATLGGLLGRFPGLSQTRMSAALLALSGHVRHFTSDRQLLQRTAALAAANWLLDAGALWCCVRAFGHTLGPVGLLVSYGIAGVLAALPFTPAGIGVVEGFLIPALVGFSVPRGIAILGVLAWRALNYLLPIPLGAAAYLSLPTATRQQVPR